MYLCMYIYIYISHFLGGHDGFMIAKYDSKVFAYHNKVSPGTWHVARFPFTILRLGMGQNPASEHPKHELE